MDDAAVPAAGGSAAPAVDAPAAPWSAPTALLDRTRNAPALAAPAVEATIAPPASSGERVLHEVAVDAPQRADVDRAVQVERSVGAAQPRVPTTAAVRTARWCPRGLWPGARGSTAR